MFVYFWRAALFPSLTRFARGDFLFLSLVLLFFFLSLSRACVVLLGRRTIGGGRVSEEDWREGGGHVVGRFARPPPPQQLARLKPAIARACACVHVFAVLCFRGRPYFCFVFIVSCVWLLLVLEVASRRW